MPPPPPESLPPETPEIPASPAGSAGDSSSLTQAIHNNAAGPKKASGDAGSVEQHSLADQIAADKYLESKKATRSRGLGIKLAKISPGGTV